MHLGMIWIVSSRNVLLFSTIDDLCLEVCRRCKTNKSFKKKGCNFFLKLMEVCKQCDWWKFIKNLINKSF
jgi:hypothetical protein